MAYALGSSLLLLLLGLVTRRLLVDNFGTQVTTASQVVSQLFNFFSIAEFGVGSVISYRLYEQIAAKNEEKISKYMEGLKGLQAFKSGDREAQLEQIITQKWIAVYPNGNEGWAEFRRTDYPRYMKTPKGGNNSGGEVANGKFIKRLRYPDSEVSNPNRPKDVDTQGTRLWWDVADTNDDGGNYVTPNNFR